MLVLSVPPEVEKQSLQQVADDQGHLAQIEGIIKYAIFANSNNMIALVNVFYVLISINDACFICPVQTATWLCICMRNLFAF